MTVAHTTFPLNLIRAVLIILFFNLTAHALAASSDYSSVPNQGTTTSPPLVLFALSFDHELFKKAYSDYSDIDGDDVMDITYDDRIDYYGYFESDWCYSYSSARFRPVSRASGTNGHRCSSASAPWSGNFMNWATMSRMDLIRKVLYGGKRSTDTSSLTVLERAEIPFDFHAWGKVYIGSDVSHYTPYSSPEITLCNLSESDRGTPKVRIRTVADNNWAGLQRTRCQGSSTADYDVRIEACHTGSTSDNCQTYGSVKKPVGLIQKYQDIVEFGLISGSFDNNVSGGVIRKNISSAQDEVNATTGQFILSSGIVSTVDALRISEYNYANSNYDCDRYSRTPSSCNDWGNPISEIYAEALRYFAGQSGPSSQYSVGSDLSLPTPGWVDPYRTDNRCANCAIIILSTGQNSYDGDEFASIADVLPSGLSQLNQLTDSVGNSEPDLSFPGTFIVGSNGGGGIRQCEPRNLTGLSNARGICPEVPEYEGSFHVAGLAYFAKNNDLRAGLDGRQNITTYAVELAQTTPSLNFGVPDGSGNRSTVSVTPVCQTIDNNSGFNERNYRPCRFLDQRIDNFTLDSSGLLNSITFRIGWADETFGGDGDTDSEATYTISTSTDRITVRISDPAFNGANSFRYGYSISGVQRYNGMVLDADYNGNYGSSGTPAINRGYDDGDNQSALIIRQCRDITSTSSTCRALQVTPDDVSKTFIPDSSVANRLPKPLFLGAKYGGFIDLDNDGTPSHDSNGDGTPETDDSREWDNKNNTSGGLGADGIPDNYFFPNNPSLLESQLEQILKDIASRISSGSSAALVSNSSSGVGSAIQGLFRPKINVQGREISWVGLLHSLFVDTNGHLREDTNNNGALDDYATDKAVSLFFDASSSQTVIQRYNSNDNGRTLVNDGATVDLTELNPIWDAREALMNVSDVTTQRTYSSVASSGRHILTWRDDNNDGEVDSGEQRPFITSTFSGSNNGYLGVGTGEVDKLVKFIRGEDQAGYRSRSVDYDNDGSLEVWRLGDIIHSSPMAIAAPNGFYDNERPYNANDSTYTAFQDHYEDRRQVVYVGSNDGMIHAFNAGFWDNDNSRFDLSMNGAARHPLGSELWAYAPMNLLPHLRYLSEPDYPHVYYMDGEPLVFDANIFTPDTDHPGGWGTVLVMGMRLGGGTIDATVNGSNRTMRSAYVVMDITNPEKPPELLAEITHPELGFTTNRPVIIQRRQPDASGDFTTPVENNWYLAFGSGPIGSGVSGVRNALDNATSNQTMKVFMFDLVNKSFVSSFTPRDSGIANAYAGNMAVVDWDQDFYDDAVYFGSVETSGNLAGRLMRINLEGNTPGSWNLTTFTNPGRPITAKPTTIANNDNERWVFAGTGREVTKDDSRLTQQEYFFGVKEPVVSNTFTNGTVLFSTLIDTTDIQVRADGDLTSAFTVRAGSTVNTFNGLLDAIKNESGWVSRLEHDGTNPSSKNISSAATTFALLLFTEYKPPTDECEIDGLSYLQALHYQTGTPIPAGTQQVITQGTITDSTISTRRIALGTGLAPAPTLHRDASGNTTIIVQGGAGNISSTALEYSLVDDGRQSWRQIRKLPQ